MQSLGGLSRWNKERSQRHAVFRINRENMRKQKRCVHVNGSLRKEDKQPHSYFKLIRNHYLIWKGFNSTIYEHVYTLPNRVTWSIRKFAFTFASLQISSQFLLFIALVFYKVTCKHWISNCWPIASKSNIMSNYWEPEVTAFLSSSQYITSFYVQSCLIVAYFHILYECRIHG